MDGSWTALVCALPAGVCGAAVVVAISRLRSGRQPPAESVPRARGSGPPVRCDWQGFVHRCERAVSDADRVVETLSSEPARKGLRAVVRRMDAELPEVRVFAELGRGLEEDPVGREVALTRVAGQLSTGVTRFVRRSQEVSGVVDELVRTADFERARRAVAALRAQFPLLPPMSVLCADPIGGSGIEVGACGPDADRHHSCTDSAAPGAATSSPSDGSGSGSPDRLSTTAPDSAASASAPATSHSW